MILDRVGTLTLHCTWRVQLSQPAANIEQFDCPSAGKAVSLARDPDVLAGVALVGSDGMK